MPYSPRQGLPKLGQTFYKGGTPPASFAESASVEGTLAVFKHVDDKETGASIVQSNHDRLMRLCRNVSGATLQRRRVVSWAPGHIGRRFDGYTDKDWDQQAAGVIDDRLTSGCPHNDLCWVCIQGPTLVKNNLEMGDLAAITEGDRLAALTGANSTAEDAGRIQSYAATNSVTANGLRILSIIGRALSSRSSGEPDSDVLCFIDLLKA